jgi:Uma2 family endonuclease
MKLSSSLRASAPAHPRVLPIKPRGGVWTDDELLKIGTSDTKYELWDGKIIAMPPAGLLHGAIIVRMAVALGNHLAEHKLGTLFDGQTGFRLSVDHCFAPDISYVSRDRLQLILPNKDKLFHGPPDLAVEVLSPSDSITKTERKVALYLAHGTKLAWMIDPKTRTARVYRSSSTPELLRGERFLTGNSVLPGFRLSLSRLFEEF